MRSTTEISIILGAYNGEKYIEVQIESVIKQTYDNWKLYIRDDQSSDNTLAIIEKYAKLDKRITIVSDESGNVGSCQNFSKLLNFIKDKGSYFMFCDQDDFWMPSKIEDTFSYMQYQEEKHSKNKPLLVYTNFQYVNVNLKVIESMKNYASTKISNLGFNHLLAQNPAYGCTMMLNKKLVETVSVIPGEAENHDYWVALVASALGEISYLKKPTIFYRQHDKNISTNYDNSSFKKRFKRIVLRRAIFSDVNAKIDMAVAFKSLYYNLLTEKNKKILNDFITLGKHKNFLLLLKNIRNGVRRQTVSQTVLFYLGILIKKG